MMKNRLALALLFGGGLAGALVMGAGLAIAKPKMITGASTATTIAGAPPPGLRQTLADSCPGYNAALVEAAALAHRINKPGEAQRFMSMRQDCNTQTAAHFRSAR